MHGTYAVPQLNTSVEGCPAEWNVTEKEEEAHGHQQGDSFAHLPVYEISYVWFSALSCLVCVVVGAAASLARRPQDPRKLNPDLISPGLKGMFSWWPRRVREAVDGIKIGEEYVSVAEVTELDVALYVLLSFQDVVLLLLETVGRHFWQAVA